MSMSEILSAYQGWEYHADCLHRRLCEHQCISFDRLWLRLGSILKKIVDQLIWIWCRLNGWLFEIVGALSVAKAGCTRTVLFSISASPFGRVGADRPQIVVNSIDDVKHQGCFGCSRCPTRRNNWVINSEEWDYWDRGRKPWNGLITICKDNKVVGSRTTWLDYWLIGNCECRVGFAMSFKLGMSFKLSKADSSCIFRPSLVHLIDVVKNQR